MNVIFMGTPQIACDVLDELIKLNNVNLLAVICQPDRKIDRKGRVVYNPVKEYCLTHNLKVLQPEKIFDLFNDLKEMSIDLIITCAYGQFIPSKILCLPKIGCFNLHASLLPKLRGGAPIHWSIINGDSITGVTLMKMVKKMDAGDIIAQISCPISPNETTLTLTNKLSILARQILKDNWIVLNDLHAINNLSKPQDEDLVTFGLNIQKHQTYINFNDTAHAIDCLIRGLYNKPIARWIYRDIEIKVHEAHITTNKSVLPPGTISKIDKNGIFISTLDYDLCITKIQMPSKNVCAVCDIINGRTIFNS